MNIGKLKIFSYSFIAFPIAFASLPIYIFLPDYYHNTYGVNLTSLSIVLFTLRLLDAVFDPIIGWYCDRFERLNIISLVFIVLFFILGMYITCSPIFTNKILNLFVGVFFVTLAFSYLTIFTTTKGALWFSDENRKSIVVSIKEIFNISGVLVASVLPFALIIYMPEQQGYFVYATIASGLIIFAGCFFIYWLKSTQINTFTVENNITIKPSISKYFKSFNSDGIFLFLAYTISALGSAIPAITLVFFSKYILNTSNLTGLYIFLYFLGAVLAIPFIKKIALKIGIINTWKYSLTFCVFIFIFAMFLGKGDLAGFGIISFLSGVGFASELILPNILLAKWIDSNNRRSLGNGYYAMFAFIGKFCFALATIVALPLLQTQLSSSSIQNLEYTIKVVYCVIPCVVKFIAMLILILWSKQKVKLT